MSDNGQNAQNLRVKFLPYPSGNIDIYDTFEKQLASYIIEDNTTVEQIANDLNVLVDELTFAVDGNSIVMTADTNGKYFYERGANIFLMGTGFNIEETVYAQGYYPSDYESFYGIGALSAEGVNPRKQSYEYLKQRNTRFVDAIDIRDSYE